jgi:hypothetical protein
MVRHLVLDRCWSSCRLTVKIKDTFSSFLKIASPPARISSAAFHRPPGQDFVVRNSEKFKCTLQVVLASPDAQPLSSQGPTIDNPGTQQ